MKNILVLLWMLLSSGAGAAQEVWQYAYPVQFGVNSDITVTSLEESPLIGTVEFHNELVQSSINSMFYSKSFTLENGVVIQVILEMHTYDADDLIRVEVPEGYLALPPEVLTKEGETSLIEIYEVKDMILG